MIDDESLKQKPEDAGGRNFSVEDAEFSSHRMPIESELAVTEEDAEQPFQSEAQDDLTFLQSFSQAHPVSEPRIPHFGHLAILSALILLGVLASTLFTEAALHFHLFGIMTIEKAESDIHYTMGSMLVLYLVIFVPSLIGFPTLWMKSFFIGIHWRFATALRLRGRLIGIACACFVLAMIDELVLPGPENAPIDQLFQTPQAAWLLFAFGVTLAPFCEEIIYRGFLLPALATAYDWIVERATGKPALLLDENDHPQWSVPAMIAASILTSIPFALMHADQTARAVGPFVLLYSVSLILCAVRLKTRSLASSVLVHASYNFMIFSFMLISTGGFRHLK